MFTNDRKDKTIRITKFKQNAILKKYTSRLYVWATFRVGIYQV